MKFTSKQVRNSFIKATKVINSCVTNEHIKVADAYLRLFDKLYIDPIYKIIWSDRLTSNETKLRVECQKSLRILYQTKARDLMISKK